jgi:hypothetical protein
MTIKPSQIEFVDPPEPRWNIGLLNGSQPRIIRELAPLRDRPGEWARVYGPLKDMAARNKAATIRRGDPVGMEPGEYEATARTLDDGSYVWVRYVGQDQAGAS